MIRSASRHGTIGLDIGGANLKAAHTSGPACLRPFALWKDPSGLADALRTLLRELPSADGLAITMTGELCDCFETRREGVLAILDQVASLSGRRPVQVWRNDGQFVDLAAARADPLPVASANWLALATYVGRLAPTGAGLVLDVGSTTTDIVPLRDGRPTPRGRTDPERLHCRELVYTGVRRTPVCALLREEGAAEWFATTADVYLALGLTPEDPSDHDTPDGRPATRANALARLARMLCSDLESLPTEDVLQLARQIAQRQAALIGSALDRVVHSLPGTVQTVVLSGSGEFLARLVVRQHKSFADSRLVAVSQVLGPDVSNAACAYALAVLASVRIGS
jgi:probable H4MPT-linked C1 transfer pathway protein